MPLKPLSEKLPDEIPGFTVERSEHHIKVSLFFPRILDTTLEDGFVSQVTQALTGYINDLKPNLAIFLAFNRVIKMREEIRAEEPKEAA
jgi:hypothetical protein